MNCPECHQPMREGALRLVAEPDKAAWLASAAVAVALTAAGGGQPFGIPFGCAGAPQLTFIAAGTKLRRVDADGPAFLCDGCHTLLVKPKPAAPTANELLAQAAQFERDGNSWSAYEIYQRILANPAHQSVHAQAQESLRRLAKDRGVQA